MPNANRGFTLIELMVVIVIIGALVAIVGPNVVRAIRKARIDTAKAQMANLGHVVELFHLEQKRLPTVLDELTRIDPQTAEPYVEHIPSDPWDQPYEYNRLGPRRYEILCFGPDQESGTEDDLRHPVVLPN